MMHRPRLWFLLLLAICAAGPAAAGGLSKQEFKGFVQAGFEDAAIAKLIRSRGIAFTFDMNVGLELQRAGIGPLALKAIREATGGGSAKQDGASAGRLLFVLDASGSMNSSLGGQTRMQYAKKAFDQILDKIPASWHVGLVVFAHRKGDCKDVELVQPVGPNQPQKLREIVRAIEAKGGTPLAYSLQQAGGHLQSFGKSSENVIVLLSDGEETCGGNPVGVARALRASGIKAIVHTTIGLAVTPGTAVQLKAIAAAGGGKYLDAQSGEALFRAMKEVVSQEYLADRKQAGGPVKAGNDYDTATVLEPGTYRLAHKLRDKQLGYFKVKVPRGHTLSVNARSPRDWVEFTTWAPGLWFSL